MLLRGHLQLSSSARSKRGDDMDIDDQIASLRDRLADARFEAQIIRAGVAEQRSQLAAKIAAI